MDVNGRVFVTDLLSRLGWVPETELTWRIRAGMVVIGPVGGTRLKVAPGGAVRVPAQARRSIGLPPWRASRPAGHRSRSCPVPDPAAGKGLQHTVAACVTDPDTGAAIACNVANSPARQDQPVRQERQAYQFFERVQQLRPLFKPPDPASRTEYQAGELAQCDLWFPRADIPLGFGHVGRPPVLVMVSGYSRVVAAVMLPTRQSPDLLAAHWALIWQWDRVPRAPVWDNESAVRQ
ncbi:hypothetical protein [Nocardia sp. NBC_00403]|uniref:hypothetical protein n=1 Tax=Nocardia sp. NBC_00403 TaxID=2975990 RepID=UPI002E244C54